MAPLRAVAHLNRSLEPEPVLPNPDLPQFPVGTQLALVRQLTLIDDRGDLTPMCLTESVQIRVYNAIPKRATIDVDGARAFQDVYTFVLSRTKLLAIIR